MKKFRVVVNLGKVGYDVEAENEDEAIKKCTENNNFIADSEETPFEFDVTEIDEDNEK